jgi:uncharacterized membrane protein
MTTHRKEGELIMERTLVVVFDDEKKAYEGKKALWRLDDEGNAIVYAYAVLVKNADGTTKVQRGDEPGPVGTLLGTTIGGLTGLLGGPVPSVIGAVSGFALGGGWDFDNLRIGEDFIEEVKNALTPNKAALIAEVDEDLTTPVDTTMEALGGTVYRRALSDVRTQMNEQDIAAMKADIAQMKAEAKSANAERKAKLDKKIAALNAKIEAQEQKAEDRRKTFLQERAAKKEILKKKAAAAGKALRNLANTPL